MTLQRREVYLCVGVGVAVCVGVAWKALRRSMEDVVSEVDTEQPVREEKPVIEPSEDAISLATLRTLVESPHPSIARAATTIVIKRFARLPEARHLLRGDAMGPDRKMSELAIHTIKYLRKQSFVTRPPRLPPSFAGRVDDDTPLASPVLLDSWSGFGYFDPLSDEWINNTATSSPSLEMSVEPSNTVAGWRNVTPHQNDANTGSQDARRRHREAMVMYEDFDDIGESDL